MGKTGFTKGDAPEAYSAFSTEDGSLLTNPERERSYAEHLFPSILADGSWQGNASRVFSASSPSILRHSASSSSLSTCERSKSFAAGVAGSSGG
jgi:hypothetical protein